MKVLLTSFGIGEASESQPPSKYFRMPPMRMVNNALMPDYAALLLCDKVVMDENSFLAVNEQAQRHNEFLPMAETVQMMHKEGYVELENFNHILMNNRELLDKMIAYDLSILDAWVHPLEKSIEIWQKFVETGHTQDTEYRRLAAIWMHSAYSSRANILNLIHLALKSSRMRRLSQYRDALREGLRTYLNYVNANLVLASELEIGFHDWADFQPFYSQKFLGVGHPESTVQREVKEAQKLFDFSFPDFAIADPKTFMKVLGDKRICDLRALVQDAVEGKVKFDDDFARSVFKEVLRIERQIAKYRNIVSYLTLPIGFLPLIGIVAPKAVEEGLGLILEKKLRRKHRWFYLLSDAEKSKKP